MKEWIMKLNKASTIRLQTKMTILHSENIEVIIKKVVREIKERAREFN